MAKRPNESVVNEGYNLGDTEGKIVATPTLPKEVPPARDSSFEVVAHRANRSLLAKDTARKKLAYRYNKQPKLSVMVAPMYAAYFGKVMHVMLNGISIAVPCDGMPYSIPKAFAEEVHRRLRAVNEAELKSKRFADVASNVEKAPGELALY
jgi:hypothetical protein